MGHLVSNYFLSISAWQLSQHYSAHYEKLNGNELVENDDWRQVEGETRKEKR